ncbi:MAG: hypothetical protein HFH33_00380 [Eubacterium sp.]|nr:hypothetical protein [Eubacterium sp.]
MKSKISLFNKAVWKRNVAGGWGLWSALFLFYILVLPVSLYGSMVQMIRSNVVDKPSEAIYPFMMVDNLWRMSFYVPIFAIAALFCAMYVFSYLFTARNSNMMHTYPVNRLSLFVTNYVSGLAILLVPAIFAALLTLAGGASLGVVTGEVVKYYMLWILTAAVENIFFYSMAVCLLMFVGNIFAVPVLYLILNFLYIGCIVILESIVGMVCFGLESGSLSRNGVNVLTPIAYLADVGVRALVYDRMDIECELVRMHVLPGYFVAAVVFVLIALAAYGKKHIETAGDVITVNWLKPIFRWGLAVCTASLGALYITLVFDSKSFVLLICSVIVIGAAAFFIAQMLLERSVHVFTKKRLRECAAYSVMICALYMALNMDVLGLEKKIPPADQVQAVRVSGAVELLSDDPKRMDWVHGLHSQILASRKELKRAWKEDTIGWSVSIDYLLKDGSTFRRSYRIPETNEIFAEIKEYAKLPEVQLEQMFGIHYPNVEVYGGIFEYYTKDGAYSGSKRISQTQANQLFEAVKEDINNGRGATKLEQYEETASTQTDTSIGNLMLELRDEAGFMSAQNYYSGLSQYNSSDLAKDGEVRIEVDQRYASLLEKLYELNILEKEKEE